MKSLSEKIAEVESYLITHQIQSISFDIDGTIYPIRKVQFAWWVKFFVSPREAMKFLKIRKTWEKRRLGDSGIPVTKEDVEFFENFLSGLLDPSMIPTEIHRLLKRLEGKKVIFVSDHGAGRKLQKLKVSGIAVNCLTQTGELKPHKKISEYLISNFDINPKTHLHLGDRWTDQEQAKLLGAHFLTLSL